MNKPIYQLLEVGPVAVSGTVRINLPIGRRIRKVMIQHKHTSSSLTNNAGNTYANSIIGGYYNIRAVRLKLNDRVQYDFPALATVCGGIVLRDQNLLHGTAYDAYGGTTAEVPGTAPGITIPLLLAQPYRNDNPDQDATSLATAWRDGGSIRSFSSAYVEVDLDDATGPELIAYAEVDDYIAPERQRIVKVLPWSIPAGSTSFEFTLLNKRDFLSQLTLYPDSGGSNTATRVRLTSDSVIKYEATRALNLAHLQQAGMSPQASGRTSTLTDIVLDGSDSINAALNLADYASTVLRVEAASAMSGTITGMATLIGFPE